jgi:hypothetical protein
MKIAPLVLGSFALVAFAAIAGAGCESETVTLATIMGNDAGGAPPAPIRCVTYKDCPNDSYYCSMTECGAPSGTCTLPPLNCDTAPYDPVCGCDDVTYFSNCLREVNGIPSYTDGECLMNPRLCGVPNSMPCPSYATCAQLHELPQDHCQEQEPGRCWVVPAQCPTTTSPDRWDSCSPLGSVCVDTCTAITNGGSYQRDPKCPQ